MGIMCRTTQSNQSKIRNTNKIEIGIQLLSKTFIFILLPLETPATTVIQEMKDRLKPCTHLTLPTLLKGWASSERDIVLTRTFQPLSQIVKLETN